MVEGKAKEMKTLEPLLHPIDPVRTWTDIVDLCDVLVVRQFRRADAE